MSRARNIKPGFFKNEILAECNPLARILFAGLWCEADREGRLEDRPKRLKVDCLPYDDCDVGVLLQELATRGFIQRYEVDGVRYIQITEFLKHQNPHVREMPSAIPAPAGTNHNLGNAKAQPRQCSGSDEHGTSPADSPFLIPDSPSPQIPTSSGVDAPEPDPIFGHGLAFLVRKGIAQKGARSFLGAMRKEVRDDLIVTELLIEAERQDVSDPLAWLRAAGRSRVEKRAAGPPGSQRQATGKQVQAIQNLEAMKHGGLDPTRDSYGLPENGVLRLGTDAGG